MVHHLLPALPPGTEWTAMASGESGDRIYRRSDGVAVAKVCDEHHIARLEGERLRIAWLTALEMGSPQVLDWMVSADGACLVMSPVPGIPANALSTAELRQTWSSLASLTKTLHALPVEHCPFERRLAGMFASAEQVVSRGAVRSAFLSPEQRHVPPVRILERLRAELPRRLEQEAQDLVVCHGDACLPNFMVDPETLRCTGLVDLGRLGLADRYADLSLLIGNSRPKWKDEAEAREAQRELFEIYGREPDAERLRFYLQLDPLTW
jgi:streptomycin 3"-kinase